MVRKFNRTLFGMLFNKKSIHGYYTIPYAKNQVFFKIRVRTQEKEKDIKKKRDTCIKQIPHVFNQTRWSVSFSYLNVFPSAL